MTEESPPNFTTTTTDEMRGRQFWLDIQYYVHLVEVALSRPYTVALTSL